MENRKEMTYQEAMDYVEELKKFGSVPGLANMYNLCSWLGNPQEELKFIHIAGSNGKGSVLSFLSEILKAAGYKTGRYLSPTIFDYRERIQINGKSISQKDLCRLMTMMREACKELVEEGNPHPTAFEIETTMAFYYFREKGCEIVVLEAGLGGLLDATNIITNTLLSIFTSISLEHMAVLGNSLQEIAENKAGIMKPGAVAVALKGDPKVMDALQKKADALAIPLVSVDPSRVSGIKRTLKKQTFSYGGYKELTISLPGTYQIENAALTVQAVRELEKAGFPITEKAMRKGLAEAFWPGRFQIVARRPYFIVDGAHNRDGARRFAESVRFYFADRKIIYIIGILRDKEQDEILKATCPLATHVLTVPTKGERGLSAYDLACMAKEYHDNVTAADSVEEAAELAYLLADKDTVIIAFGSLSYLGDLIRYVEKLSGKKNEKSYFGNSSAHLLR